MDLEYVFIGNMEETKENQQLRFNDPKEFAELLDKHAGNNIINRMFKLREAYHELLEAWHDLDGCLPKDYNKCHEAFIDELADVNAVLFHIAAMNGLTQEDLLQMAYDKFKQRLTNPNYKRKHPHKGK